MRIVYIVKYIAQYGGLDRVISYKMNYLAEKLGYEVYLLTYEQGNHPQSFPLSSKIKHIDINVRFFTRHKYSLLKRMYLYFNMRFDFKKRINENLAAINPDIVVTTTYSYTLLDILMNISKKYKIVVESHVDRNSILKQNDFLYSKLMFFIAKLYDKCLLRSLNKCDVFVTLTEGDCNQWTGLQNKMVIPNPISLNSKGCSSLKEKRIISVGRLEPQKGFDMLIDAWKIVSEKHKDWSLDIYGDGGLRESLEKQIQKLNLSDSCTIHRSTENIEDKYIESSIYVMSSLYEGFGLVLVEAMSFGIPCVSFDCPYGPSDIISNNVDGILVEPKNISKLAEAICMLIEDEQKRMQFGEKAKQNVQRYIPENIMPQWDELFRSLLK